MEDGDLDRPTKILGYVEVVSRHGNRIRGGYILRASQVVVESMSAGEKLLCYSLQVETVHKSVTEFRAILSCLLPLDQNTNCPPHVIDLMRYLSGMNP